MGPLRGRVTPGLATFLITLPAGALAGPCDTDGAAAASAGGMLLRLSAEPAVLALLAVAGFALHRRRRVTFAIAGGLWGLLAFAVAADNHKLFFDDKSALGIIEVCTASPHLFIALAIAICAEMTCGALRPRT